MVWAPGHKLKSGKYEIGEILGQGGFGITYKALNTQTNEYVVIKTPNEYLKHDPDYDEYVRKFKREAEMLKKFSANPHPHIVCIRNFFQEEDSHCLVMDFVDGETLFEVVNRRGRIPEKEAIKYIRQIGSALGDFHKAGAVHRDAHPGNIMIEDGKAILIDFGIAKDLTPNTQTSTGNVGNKGFAPYEQLIRGSREPNVDIYCLAAAFYFILTGKHPINSVTRKLERTRLVPPKKIIHSISKEISKAIVKGMELESNKRPKSVEEWLFLVKREPSNILWGWFEEMPWDWLIGVAFIYGVLSCLFGYISLTSINDDHTTNIFLLISTAPLSIFGAVIWSRNLFFYYCLFTFIFAIILVFIGGTMMSFILVLMLSFPISKKENLETELFLVINHFFILLLTSSLGIAIGWLVSYLFYLLFTS